MANAGKVNDQIAAFKEHWGEYMAAFVGYDNTTIENMQAHGQQLAELLQLADATLGIAIEDIRKQGNAMHKYGMEGDEGDRITSEFHDIFIPDNQDEPTNPHAAAAHDHLCEVLVNRQGFVEEELSLGLNDFQDLRQRLAQLALDASEATMRFVGSLEKTRDDDIGNGLAVLQELDNYGVI